MLGYAIYQFGRVLVFLIVVRALMSWVVRDTNNPFVRTIHQITEPILEPFRKLLTQFGLGGTIDFSPILAILAIQFIAGTLARML